MRLRSSSNSNQARSLIMSVPCRAKRTLLPATVNLAVPVKDVSPFPPAARRCSCTACLVVVGSQNADLASLTSRAVIEDLGRRGKRNERYSTDVP